VSNQFELRERLSSQEKDVIEAARSFGGLSFSHDFVSFGVGNGVDLGVACADGCRSRAGYWQRRKDIWSRCIAGKEISFECSLVKAGAFGR